MKSPPRQTVSERIGLIVVDVVVTERRKSGTVSDNHVLVVVSCAKVGVALNAGLAVQPGKGLLHELALLILVAKSLELRFCQCCLPIRELAEYLLQ